MTPILYPDLQLLDTWTEEGDSPGAHGLCKITPGTPTTPMLLGFTPAKRSPGQLWDNAYVLHRNAASPATNFAYWTEISFPTAQDIANCEAFEMDFQQSDGKTIFNCGWQFLFGHGLRIWNKSAKGTKVDPWGNTVLPASAVAFTPGIPKRITALFSRSSVLGFAKKLTYIGISIDGLWTPLNITYPAVPKVENPYVNCAVQLDSKGQGAPINCAVHECTLLGY